jgi:hypothetical protein
VYLLTTGCWKSANFELAHTRIQHHVQPKIYPVACTRIVVLHFITHAMLISRS